MTVISFTIPADSRLVASRNWGSCRSLFGKGLERGVYETEYMRYGLSLQLEFLNLVHDCDCWWSYVTGTASQWTTNDQSSTWNILKTFALTKMVSHCWHSRWYLLMNFQCQSLSYSPNMTNSFGMSNGIWRIMEIQTTISQMLRRGNLESTTWATLVMVWGLCNCKVCSALNTIAVC